MKRFFVALVLLVTPVSVLAQTQPETIEYYGVDKIGSIRIVFDVNGTALGRQDYAPFGKPLFTVPAMPKEGLAGNEQDAETQQQYFHARMFEPRTGRFTRVDAVFDGLFKPQAWNRYAYALNSPEVVSDPDGDDPITSATNGCQQSGHAPIEYYLAGCWGQLGSGVSIYGIAILYDTCFILHCYPFGPPAGLPRGGTGATGGTGTGTGTGGSGDTGTDTPPPPAPPPPPGPPTSAPPSPNETCRQQFLKGAYPVIGSHMSNWLVPEFSGISLATNLSQYAKGSVLSLGLKGVVVGLPALAGKVASTTAKNLRAYPGMATAAADAAETGLFWSNTAAVSAEAFAVGITGISAFATAADAYARWECRTVK